MAVDVNELLDFMIQQGASALHLDAGAPPTFRMGDDLTPIEHSPLSPEELEGLVRELCTNEQFEILNRIGTVDFELSAGENLRFQVMAFKHGDQYGLTLCQAKTIDQASLSKGRVDMHDLLDMVVNEGVSDLHIEVGTPPLFRISGDLTPLDYPPLTPEDTEYLVHSILSDAQWEALNRDGTVDLGIPFEDRARFRVSAFKQKSVYGTVLRQIPSKLLTLEQIGLPKDTVHDLLYRPRGLILVTGPTGSGKSTTLASMIDIINQERPVHIITIEDPIEFYHNHKKACVIQREVGTDVPAFDEALRRALRQDPEVILVGEMRDLETMRAAITAAETGHLVFGTLHTTGAARTVDRIVDAFPTDQQEQIRTQLAESLVAVISQVLLPRIDRPGRVAAFEVMLATPSVKALIRENKTYRIPSELQTGSKYGMFTLDSHLLELYKRKVISYKELTTKCQDPQGIQQALGQEKG